MKTQNTALLLKYLDKFYNSANLPWVKLTWDKLYANTQIPPQARAPTRSFWWKDILKIFSSFKSVSVCIPKRGNSALVWLENWSGNTLKLRFPHLFSFARKPKASILFFNNQTAGSIFRLPLTQVAADEYTDMRALIKSLGLENEQTDRWKYLWGDQFAASKAYKNLRGTIPVSPLFKWLWSSSNPGKQKFFFWLLLRDRLNTRNLLRRKNRNLNAFTCVLCNHNIEEDLFHLFFGCTFSQNCWSFLHIAWDLNLAPLDMVIEARRYFGHVIFREILIAACWSIWKMRNSIIFDNETCSFQRWKIIFKIEFGLVCIKAKGGKKTLLKTWLQQLS